MENLDIYKTPGQLVSALIACKGWTNRLLAAVLCREETFVSKIISDKVSMTAEIAIQLEEIFSVPADTFLTLQKNYDLAKARYTTTPDPKRASRARLLSDLPISEMIKRGWLSIQNTKNLQEIENAVAKFFGSSNNDWVEVLPHAAKKTNVNGGVPPIQLAWLYKVKSIASNMLTTSYSPQKAIKLLDELRPLLIAPEEARKVPKLFSEAGIRLVFVESLRGAKIDGVCFWLDDNKPIIGMSLRFDRMDNFWFVLRHELEHVIQEHGKDTLHIDGELSDGVTESLVNPQEVEANAAAADFGVSETKINSFIARKSPLFPERDFLGFSKIVGVHPCVVAGRIRHKTQRFELFKSHDEKIRHHVLPSAIVDGWGDVAPIFEI